MVCLQELKLVNPPADALHVGSFMSLFTGRFNIHAMPVNMQLALSPTLADLL